MSKSATLNLEQSLANTEADAQVTLEIAKDLMRPLRKLRLAAETGNLVEIDASIYAAEEALTILQKQLNETKKGWDFDTRRYLNRGGYARELMAAAHRSGLNMVEREDRLFCYPTLIRVAPEEKAVYINRKRESRVRPSVFVHLLKEQQNRPLTFQPRAFLEALYQAYCKTLADKGEGAASASPIIPLVDIHDLLTLLPGQAKEYSRQEFVRDIYLLHKEGVDTTKRGAKVSFPISRGVRGKTLTVIDETGEERRYYGIRFFPPVSRN